MGKEARRREAVSSPWQPILLALLLAGAACRHAETGAEPATEAATEADASGPAQIVEAHRELLGTDFRISLADVPEGRARSAIEEAFAEVARVERLLSSHIEESDVSRINAGAGTPPVTVSEETISLLEAAQGMSALSGGAFDITFAALSAPWRGVRETPPRLPDDEAIRQALSLVGYRNVRVDRQQRTVHLPRQGMRIGLGGIGKGHAVDQASKVLVDRGITSFIVGGGGDLLVRGSKRGVPWRLGIQHPRNRGALLGEISLPSRGALVTSGDYERFIVVDGVRYHHILDPRTGRPARGCSGVTLLAPTATQADALATAVFVLGPDEGMRLVERLDGVEAVIVDEHLAVTISPGLRDRVRLLEPR